MPFRVNGYYRSDLVHLQPFICIVTIGSQYDLCHFGINKLKKKLFGLLNNLLFGWNRIIENGLYFVGANCKTYLMHPLVL